MIQLTRSGLICTDSETEIERLREEFDRQNYIILKRLIEPVLFDTLVKRVESAPFEPYNDHDIAIALRMADEPTRRALSFLASNPEFLRVVETITGATQLGKFDGRVYCMRPDEGHYDTWHDDLSPGRGATMSINLSRQPYTGGALQMKKRGAEVLSAEIYNVGLGDALIFRISNSLIHRVDSVTGDVPKCAFAGWFVRNANR